jgi:hypothetical protein
VDDPSGKQTERQAEERITDPLSNGEIEVSPALGSHDTGGADRPHGGGNDGLCPPRNFLFRLSVNEWLTFGIAALSLFISYLTYRNAADTSDIKSAIGNLSELAVQTKRQADATNGQLAEMSYEQRPWLQVVPQIKGPLTNDEGRLVVDIGLAIKNSGRTPAVSVMGKAELKAREGQWAKIIGALSTAKGVDVLKSICRGTPNDIWKYSSEGVGADIIFPGSDDIIVVEARTDGVADKELPSKGAIWGFDTKGRDRSFR